MRAREIAADLIGFAGIALILSGAWAIWPPLALLLAGAAAVRFGLVLSGVGRRDGGEVSR
jgi:hypothetical protein